MADDRPSPLVFVLFRARYGWLLTVGVVLAAERLNQGERHAAATIAAIAVVLAVVTFVRSDLPRLRELRRRSS